jgi:hypothetical protein
VGSFPSRNLGKVCIEQIPNQFSDLSWHGSQYSSGRKRQAPGAAVAIP